MKSNKHTTDQQLDKIFTVHRIRTKNSVKAYKVFLDDQAKTALQKLLMEERGKAIASYKKIQKLQDIELEKLLVEARIEELRRFLDAPIGAMTRTKTHERIAELRGSLGEKS